MIGIVKVCILHVLSIIFSYSKYIVSTCNGVFVFGLVIHYPMNGQNPHPSLPWAKTGMSPKLQPTIDYCLHKNRTIDLFGLHFPLLREVKCKCKVFSEHDYSPIKGCQ